MMRWFSQIWTQLWITLVVAVVSLALYTSLGRQLIPLIESLQPDIEQQISQALQQPVSIGRFKGDWRILSPIVLIHDVTLGDPDTGLKIGKVEAELDISATLFHQQPVFKRILIADVSGHITQQQKRHWQIAKGWQIELPDKTGSNDTATPPASADQPEADNTPQRPAWLTFLELQQAIVLQDWRLTHDGLEFDDQLEIRELIWRNRANSRALEGQVAWGLEEMANISVRATLQGQIWPIRQQQGEFYLAVDPQSWSRWIPGNPEDSFHINQLIAGFKGWGTIGAGRLNSLYGNLDVMSLDLATPNKPMTLTNGQITMRAERQRDDWHMRVSPQFEQALPLTEFSLSGIPLGSGKAQQHAWQLGIPELNVAALSGFIQDYGLLAERHMKYVRNLEPIGIARHTRLSLIAPELDQHGKKLNPQAGWKFALATDLDEVSSLAYKGIPAMSDITASLLMTPSAGKVTINDGEHGLFLEGIYAEPWRLTDSKGAFYWQIAPEHFRLQLKDMQARLNDVGLTIDVGLRLPRTDSDVEPNTSVLMAFERAPAAMTQMLVPDLLDESITSWIDNSILDGDFRNGVFALNGRLGKQPPSNSNSIQLYMDVGDARLRYLQDWPEVTDLNGRMLLDSPSMDVWVDSGKTLGGSFVDHSARVKLRSNSAKDGTTNTVLQVSGKLAGSSDQALRYFTETPLQQLVQNGFDQWQATGPITASMLMQIPLGQEKGQKESEEGAAPDIKLDVALRDNTLRIGEVNLDLEQLNGALRFDSDIGILSDSISGSVMGGSFSGNIQSVQNGNGFDIHLNAKGDAQWAAFKQWMPLFLLDPINGDMRYKASLDILPKPRGGTTFKLNTDLAGTEIQLPTPLGKTAEQKRSLALSVKPGSDLRVNLNYDGLLKSALALHDGELERGQVYIGGGDPFLPSDKGVSLRGHIPQQVNAEKWWGIWQQLNQLLEQHEQEVTAQHATNKPGSTPGKTKDTENPLTHIDLQLGGVDAWGVATGPMHIQASHEWNEWDINLDSDLVKGLVVMKPDNQPIDMQLEYIRLPYQESDPAAIEETVIGDTAQASDHPQPPIDPDPLQDVNPADFPAMTLKVNELYLGSRNFGYWHVSSQPQADGMNIQLHDSNMKGMAVTGDIAWLKQDGHHLTLLDTLQMRGEDAGKILQEFRVEPFVTSNDMKASAKLSWQGSPMNFNVATLNGLASMRLRDGQLAADGAGALKAFGILNFNSISRRLRLDFSDLYQSGIAFDVYKGKGEIVNGQLTLTEPLLVDGPGGKFRMSGTTSLIDRDMDMQLAVTFPITGTLPVVAVLAGFAPPVAAAIYVSEKLVGDELEQFTSASYTVKGTWEEPDLQINQRFNNDVEGKESRSFKQRFLSIFGLDDDDE